MKTLSISACLFLALAVGPSASRPATVVVGAVVDEQTGLPVPDAYVIGRWTYHGSDGVGSRSICTGIEVVRTDHQGRFVLPEARPRKELGVSVFAPGKHVVGGSALPTGFLTVLVRKFEGDSEARLFHYERLSSARVCSRLPGTLGKLRGLFAAMDEEAATLPGLNEDQYRPGRFSRALAQLEVKSRLTPANPYTFEDPEQYSVTAAPIALSRRRFRV